MIYFQAQIFSKKKLKTQCISCNSPAKKHSIRQECSYSSKNISALPIKNISSYFNRKTKRFFVKKIIWAVHLRLRKSTFNIVNLSKCQVFVDTFYFWIKNLFIRIIWLSRHQQYSWLCSLIQHFYPESYQF